MQQQDFALPVAYKGIDFRVKCIRSREDSYCPRFAGRHKGVLGINPLPRFPRASLKGVVPDWRVTSAGIQCV